jgi:hypothetical protein
MEWIVFNPQDPREIHHNSINSGRMKEENLKAV